MRKTMMLAGLLLTLGTGAAFANDGDVFVPQLDNVVVNQSSPTVRVPTQPKPVMSMVTVAQGYGLGRGRRLDLAGGEEADHEKVLSHDSFVDDVATQDQWR